MAGRHSTESRIQSYSIDDLVTLPSGKVGLIVAKRASTFGGHYLILIQHTLHCELTTGEHDGTLSLTASATLTKESTK